jgi:hypothetical protein
MDYGTTVTDRLVYLRYCGVQLLVMWDGTTPWAGTYLTRSGGCSTDATADFICANILTSSNLIGSTNASSCEAASCPCQTIPRLIGLFGFHGWISRPEF